MKNARNRTFLSLKSIQTCLPLSFVLNCEGILHKTVTIAAICQKPVLIFENELLNILLHVQLRKNSSFADFKRAYDWGEGKEKILPQEPIEIHVKRE